MHPLLLQRLYVIDFALLAAHEVDSGYWREWELFGLPGGIQLFVVLNLALFLLFSHGLVQVASRKPSGVWYALGLAGAGLFAAVVHGTFLALGDDAFTTPVSLGVLGVAGVVSLGLAVVTVRERHDPVKGPA